jgi:hypothetical protein
MSRSAPCRVGWQASPPMRCTAGRGGTPPPRALPPVSRCGARWAAGPCRLSCRASGTPSAGARRARVRSRARPPHRGETWDHG